METKIQKWGNSLGVRLPKNIAQSRSLKEGMRVVVSERDSKIVIEAVPDAPRTLSDMLSDIKESNLHAESDWGESMGNEVW